MRTEARGLVPILLALGIGLAGALAFVWARLPLPWMLGPMLANLIACLLHAPVRGPSPIRPYVVVVIGVMLGAGFTPALLEQIGAWSLSLAALTLYLAACAAITVPFYRRVGGLDPATAYFAGMPGGLSEMVEIGRTAGADERAIALAHTARIVLVVFLVAFWFRWVEGLALGDRAAMGTPLAEVPARELTLLTLAGVVGFVLGRLTRLPAPALIGPMLASAVLHLAGLSTSRPPAEFVNGAQLFLGTIIGCRFAGTAAGRIGRAFAMSLGATALMLVLTAIFALTLAALTGQDTLQAVLAFAPGGLAEMSLVALATGSGVAYVATHHMARIVLVILCAPLAYRLVAHAAGKDRP